MLKISKKWIKVICILGSIIGAIGIISLTIWGIYKISNQEVKDITTSIVAAVYGGVITLIGVAWTIKNSEKNIRLENKMKNKPILILVEGDVSRTSDMSAGKVAYIREDKQHKLNYNVLCVMKNISQIPCKVIGVNYLGREIQCTDKYLWLENQENVKFYIKTNDFDYKNTKEIELILEDVSGIRYSYLLEYDNIGNVLSIREKE